MRDQIYEVTPQRQWSLLSYMLIIHGILIAAYIYYYGLLGNTGLLIAYGVFFMLDALPTIRCHLQYLAANRNATLIVRPQLRTLSYTRDEEHYDYSFDDIQQIIYVAGFGNGAWYSFSEYRYFVLIFKDGKQILISSLMISYNKKSLEGMFGITVKTKMRLIPTIRNVS
jgi:hypothetical protein